MAGRAEITVRGVVQGVGFRPFVFNLAKSLHLRGYVSNSAEGVIIDVEGDRVPEFLERLRRESPPLSQITDVSVTPLPECGYHDFRIVESRDDGGCRPFTLVSPDVSVCDDCLKELLDPRDRRYLYPFINCTNCGPRYSITRAVPYDRPNTTMAPFRMCEACSGEYNDPGDRRFHAQPNACPECGPGLEFKIQNSKFKNEKGERPLEGAVRLLKEGGIVAVKGLGGFHIACDAEKRETVERLRELKRRSNKPFALMAPHIEAIEKFCLVSEEEKRLLLSKRRPIVLLRKRVDAGSQLPQVVSPNNRYLGFMLPYTPLHYLLFYLAGADSFNALVMTSGNMSEEPIARDNDEASLRLKGLVDAILSHNRDIFMRVDDSVVRVPVINRPSLSYAWAGKAASSLSHQPEIFFVRRSRGYAPDAIALHSEGPQVMGCGADIKNTFTLTKGGFAIPSQHIGDMENYETLNFFEECFENLRGIYRVTPSAIGHDLHPGYLSTRWALRYAAKSGGVRTIGVQHHYAHVASVMAEHGLRGKVLGVAFDGTGYGTDGNLWGGEFLLADIRGFQRVGRFRYIPLPGGETAIREPWRTAVSYLLDATGDEAMDYLGEIGFVQKYGEETLRRIIKIAGSQELSPLSCGAGRLFDAVSSLIGLCDRNTFEGEAAMALDALVEEETDGDYPVNIIIEGMIYVDFSPTIVAIVNDLLNGRERHLISVKFHNTIANVILRTAASIRETHRIRDVVLSGGTFQNMYLLGKTMEMLTSQGMNVFINESVPCNDACISLGQAYIVRERLK